MLEFRKVDKRIEEILEVVDYESIYKLVEDDRVIGFGTINKDKENAIYIFISENYKGNGYGTFLFKNMLEEVKKERFKEIKVIFDKDNIQMLKIVKKFEGLHISSVKEKVKYVVPIK